MWIDCIKLVAIIAVLVDHCNGILYDKPVIAQASYFSVSLFVMLSGITMTATGTKRLSMKKQVNRIKNMFVQYMVATLIILLYYNRFFDLKTYVYHVLNFSIQGPYYFLLFFFQILLIAPMLLAWYHFCEERKNTILLHCLTVAFLFWISSLFIRYTYILPVHGGGQFLFGGTYIVLYYLGVILGKFLSKKRTGKQYGIILLFATAGWLYWLIMRCYNKLTIDIRLQKYFGNGFNPPSLELIIYTVLTLFLLYALFLLLELLPVYGIKKCLEVAAFAGKNTLYVFMYHLLVKDIMMTSFPILMSNIWTRRIFVFIPMLVVPIVGNVWLNAIVKNLGVYFTNEKE